MTRDQLLTLCGYASRRSPAAVMNSVRITETFGFATDGPSQMRCTWEGPSGLDVCVDAGILHGQLSSMPSDKALHIEPADGFVTLFAGRRRLKLRTIPPLGMPEIEVRGQGVSVDELEFALRFCAAATGPGIPRPELANVLVEIADDGVWVVGLDGYRMHYWLVDSSKIPEERMSVLIPRAAAKKLADLGKQGGDIILYRDRARVVLGEMTYTCCLAAGVFPPWRNVTPKDDKVIAKCDVGSKPLSMAMHGARQMGAKFATLALREGEAAVSASEQGDEYEQIVELDFSGPNSDINVNPAFVVDAMEHMDVMSSMAICNAGAGKGLLLKSFQASALIQGMRG